MKFVPITTAIGSYLEFKYKLILDIAELIIYSNMTKKGKTAMRDLIERIALVHSNLNDNNQNSVEQHELCTKHKPVEQVNSV